MSQLRKFPQAISNYFDDVERGVGKRGSTFTDVDAVSHDKDTKRFLFREFKHETEPLSAAQRWVLQDLAGLPRCTVWLVRRLGDGLIGWAQFGVGQTEEEVITEVEYCRRLFAWWYAPPLPQQQPLFCECGQANGSRFMPKSGKK
jgi:hypothetical protein